MSKQIKSQYIPEQLALGASIEMEHTDNPAVAMKIAMQHLNEDKHYYTKLAKMEAKFAEGGISEDNLTAEEKKKIRLQNEHQRNMDTNKNKEDHFPKFKNLLKDDEEPVDKDFNLGDYTTDAKETEYADGGEVVKGNKFAGDTIDAKINSGEMILNLEQQQRLLDLIRSQKPEFADGGVKQVFDRSDFVSSTDAEKYLNKLRNAHTLYAAKEAAGDTTAGLLKDVVSDKIGSMTNLIKKAGKFAIPAAVGAGALRVALGPEAAIASEVLGSEDVGAGSDEIKNEPTDKEVQNVKKQMEVEKLPNAYEQAVSTPKLANGGRVDEQVDNGNLNVNTDQQKRLMDLLRGDIELDSLGCDNIVDKPHFAEGGNVPYMSGLEDIYAPETNPNQLPAALQADYKEPVPVPANTAALPYMSGAPSTTLAPAPLNAEQFNPIEGPKNPLAAPSVIQPIGSSLSVPIMPEATAIDTTAPTPESIKQAELPIKQERSKIVATKKVDDEWAANQKAFVDFTNKKLADQDAKNKEIPPSDFWAIGGTPNKIMSGIAIALGAVGAAMTGSGKNYALDIIQNAIQNDIAKQKLSKEEALAKQEHGLKLAKFEVDKTAQKIDNDKKKLEMVKLSQDMQTNITNLNLQRQKLAMMQSGKQIDPALLNEDELSKSIIDPRNNKRYFATAGTKETAQKVRDYQNEIYPALDSISKIRELGKEGYALPFTERAAQVNTEMQALIGNLRLPITGPGILTESERKMLAGIIGNPTAVLSFSGVENAKLDQIEAKLKKGMDTQYKTAGINMPKDTNQTRIQQLKARGLNETQATAALKRTNLWDNE